jgi:hypothetical protein
VFSVRRLSPRLDQVDVIVWAPNDFRPPSEKAYEFLENWLQADMERVLIYVGRDYDAAAEYWEEILSDATSDQALEIQRRLAEKQSNYDAARRAMPEEHRGPWFIVHQGGAARRARTLQGPWSDGIDASMANIRLRSTWELPRPTNEEEIVDFSDTVLSTALLESGGDLLVGQVHHGHWGDSQVIVVANGSFLLNLPLVNHEHRKLAGRLVKECGGAGRNVAFLQSGPGPVSVSDRDREMHHLLRAFTEWPINCILLHLTMLGIVYCFCNFPILGRPRELSPDPPSDFGKHVDALGRLLERTADRTFASSRVAHYLRRVRRDLGTSPFKPHENGRLAEELEGDEPREPNEPNSTGKRPPSEQP